MVLLFKCIVTLNCAGSLPIGLRISFFLFYISRIYLAASHYINGRLFITRKCLTSNFRVSTINIIGHFDCLSRGRHFVTRKRVNLRINLLNDFGRARGHPNLHFSFKSGKFVNSRVLIYSL